MRDLRRYKYQLAQLSTLLLYNKESSFNYKHKTQANKNGRVESGHECNRPNVIGPGGAVKLLSTVLNIIASFYRFCYFGAIYFSLTEFHGINEEETQKTKTTD